MMLPQTVKPRIIYTRNGLAFNLSGLGQKVDDEDGRAMPSLPMPNPEPASSSAGGSNKKRSPSDFDDDAPKSPSKAPAQRLRKKQTRPDIKRTEMRTDATIEMVNGDNVDNMESLLSGAPPKETPDWYPAVTVAERELRNGCLTLRGLRSQLTVYNSATGPARQKAETDLCGLLHQLSLTNFHGNEKAIIRESCLLTDGTFTLIIANTPTYLSHLARQLYKRWWRGDTEPNLFRGMTRSNSKCATTGRNHISYTLDPDYPFRASLISVGQGHLHNGDWWPLQICAVRDGAHGAVQAGISGHKALGATSIIVSGARYDDIDNGESLQYYGTTSPGDGKVSPNTTLMITAFEKKSPIRVLRGAKTKSIYCPARGLRYDGLYIIKGYEIVEPVTVMHRFTLERVEGQEPLCYSGKAQRPHELEILAIKRDEEMRNLQLNEINEGTV